MMNNNPNDLLMPNGYDPYKDMNDDERMRTGCAHIVAYAVAIGIGLFLCAVLGSCTTTKYVPVYHHTTDTLRLTQHHRDSIYLSDSIYVTDFMRGDTVYKTVDRWRTRYVERTRTDTIYQAKTDSIPVPYPVEKEVPAPLTWWQQTRLHLANIMLCLLAVLVIVYAGKRFLP